MPDLAAEIRQLVARHPDIRLPVGSVSDAHHFRDHLGADDLVRLDLTLVIERAYGIEFSPDDFEFDTVGELIEAVAGKLAAKTSGRAA